MAVKRVGRQMPTVACVTARARHQTFARAGGSAGHAMPLSDCDLSRSDCVLLVGRHRMSLFSPSAGAGGTGPAGGRPDISQMVAESLLKLSKQRSVNYSGKREEVVTSDYGFRRCGGAPAPLERKGRLLVLGVDQHV